MLAAAAIAAPFALRAGVPGLRHDWLWSPDARILAHWALDSLSTWNPRGFGSDAQPPEVNFVLLAIGAFSWLGVPPHVVLFFVIWTPLAAGAAGMLALLRRLEIAIAPAAALAIALSYAASPVLFQKSIAGHIYYLAAYALLPWFAAAAWDAASSRKMWSALLAGLLLGVMSAQLQFCIFGAFAAAVIFAVHGAWRRFPVWLLICVIGALPFANTLVHLAGGSAPSVLAQQHATLQWEIDQSTRARDLLLLRGYVHYDRAAVSPIAYAAMGAGAAVLTLLALAGLLLARRSRAALAFALIAAAAFAYALGLYGPLSGAFVALLERSNLFTIFREFYHGAGLYVFALCVLAAAGAARLRSAAAQCAAAAACLLIVLPFASNGLARLVPAVRSETWPSAVLYPIDQPLELAADPASNGLDPDAMNPRDAGANAQGFVYAIMEDTNARERDAALAELGFSGTCNRPALRSAIPHSFEPNTGATFGAFLARQRIIRAQIPQACSVFKHRALVQAETPGSAPALAPFLAGIDAPPGEALPVTYSYASNDIRTQWVGGDLWRWYWPQAMRVQTAPAITRSHAPYAIPGCIGPGTLYVLAISNSVSSGGIAAQPLAPDAGAYRWWRIPLAQRTCGASIAFAPPAALARIIVSPSSSWRPARMRGTSASVQSGVLQASWTEPWSVSGTLAPRANAATLVLAQRYSPHWHLRVNGADEGSAARVDAILNGWRIGAQRGAARFEMYDDREARALAVSISVIALYAAGALLCLYRFARKEL